jgi:hypothetical protein
MKIIQRLTMLLLAVTFCRCCFAIDGTNVIGLGAWSETVANDYGRAIRGRLLMCAYPDHRGGSTNRADVGVYLELQEYSDSIGGTRVYCDFTHALKCELSDAFGKAPPYSGGFGYGGGAPGPLWISLPPFSSMRLRASVFGGGKLTDGTLEIMFIGAGSWRIKPNDTNTYFLSGTFAVNPPPDTNSFNHTEIWRGTLSLPKMEIPRLQP